MFRIVFLAVNASWAHRSLALPAIHAAAGDRRNVEWHAVQVANDADPTAVAARIADLKPDCVMATLYLFTRDTVLKILRRVAALCPDVLIAAGGPECLGDTEELLFTQPIDLVFCGDGEEAVREWLKHPRDPDHWEAIGSISHCCGDVYFAGTPAVADVARLPSPTSSRFFATDRPFVQLESSRGCRGVCSFCTSWNQPLRLRPLPAVREELQFVYDRGVRELRLLDRSLGVPAKRGIALLRLFREEYPDLRVHCEIDPRYLTAPFRAELARARPGQLHLEVGLQSGNNLAVVDRCGDPKDAWAAVKWLCKLPGVDVHVDLLAGLPKMRLADVFRDVQQLTCLGPEEIQLETLKVLPGTPLAVPLAGLTAAYDPPYEVLKTRTMSTADLLTARQLSVVLDRFHNAPALRPIIRDAAREKQFYRDFLAFLVAADAAGQPLSLDRRLRLLADYFAERDRTLWERVAVVWMEQGLGRRDGPVPATRQAAGPAAGPDLPDAKWWSMAVGPRTWWFAYTGGSAGKQAAATHVVEG